MFCPFCKKNVNDILKHLSIQHDIESMEQCIQEMEKLEEYKTKQIEFRKRVDELQKMQKNGDISDTEYRQLITEWSKQNKI